MTKLSVIIVSYNVKFFLEQCLRSCIKATQNLEAEIIVVDNNSVDESAEMVKEKFSNIKLIHNKVNVGFSKANNQAILKAKGDFILLLNPDTLVEEDAFEKSLLFMKQQKEVGAVGVQMIDGKGVFLDESKRGIPDFKTSLFKFLGLHKIFPKSKYFNHYYLGDLEKDKRHEVDILVGAFMLLRKSVLDEVGLLDEQFFMYWEDTDLCMRIREKGYKNYYLGDIKIIHYKGESNKRHTLSFTIGFNKSMLAFVKKHFSKHLLFLPLIKLATIVKAIMVLIRDFIKTFSLPIIDFTSILFALLLLTNYWGENYAPYPFSETFTKWLIPSYITIWIVSLFFSGAYDKPFRINRVARGVIFGLLVIATFSNFFNTIRFSRVIIIVGGVLVFTLFVTLRFLYRILTHKDFDIAEKRALNLLLVSKKSEFKRAEEIITNSKHNTKLIGYLNEKGGNGALGSFSDMDSIIKKHNIDEVVFASSYISFKEIIKHLISLSATSLNFKILPENSHFLIGSNSRETLGDYYCPDSNWELSKTSNKRNKRVLDIFLSFLFLIFAPILMWYSSSPTQFLKNIISILRAEKTFVGFNKKYESHFPNIRKGVLMPTSHLKSVNIDSKEVRNINMRYAKDYSARKDLFIIFKCLNQLG
ncbi:MAG: glycosyltransferase [Flavobacteriales bacterium]|nr:glycosyltransferase [Flavobacteriales bacterium]